MGSDGEAAKTSQKIPRGFELEIDVSTGRPRGVYRDFGLSRLEFRRLALKG